MDNNIENLNNSSEEKSNKIELSEQEKSLLKKVIDFFSTSDNIGLGKYSY